MVVKISLLVVFMGNYPLNGFKRFGAPPRRLNLEEHEISASSGVSLR